MFSNDDGTALGYMMGANQNNDGFGGNNGIWAILLLSLLGFGRGGWGGYGGYGEYAPMPIANAATPGDVERAFDTQTIINKLNGLENGLCDGFYAMNTTALNGFNDTARTVTAVGADLGAAIGNVNITGMQNTNAILKSICDLGYNAAAQSDLTRHTIIDSARDIIENQNTNYRAMMDYMVGDKIATLTAENQNLKFAASQQAQNAYLLAHLAPAPIPAYNVPNPYANYPLCGCGC